MAVYDHQRAERQRSTDEAFEKFKKHLAKNALEGDNISIRMKIEAMEEDIEILTKNLKEYRDFFSKLNSFLPKEPSMYNPLI